MKFKTDFQKVEKNISGKAGSYPDLEVHALLTSEEDFRTIFNELPEIKSWVELGSGHGLGPLLFGSLFSDKSAIGIEFENARFEASVEQKIIHQLNNVTFIHGDLLTCEIPHGDAYFFYFPTGMVLDRILSELGNRKDFFRIIAIESHGDFISRLRKESWLKEVKSIPLTSLRHHPAAIVFEKNGEKKPNLHDCSFIKKFLSIQDENGIWIGESYGLEWIGADQYQLLIPPRTFRGTDVKEVLLPSQIPVKILHALQLRRLGELKIVTREGEKSGSLRKIYVAPSFKVEISSGEQVEWERIKQIFWEHTLCFDSSSDYFFLPPVV